MNLAASLVLGAVVDICTRSFLLLSDQAEERMVECDTLEQFLNVLALVRRELESAQIAFADIAVAE